MKGRHFRSLSKEKVKSKFQEFEMSVAGLQYVPPVFDSSYSIAFSSLSLCDSCYDFFLLPSLSDQFQNTMYSFEVREHHDPRCADSNHSSI